ncbi:hypothetical protein JY651_33700 [Pyxidicoccus parkwayensis]|uniref:Uncharacterized protein n=1 Tax=Pyxidicoccus parkwayensis TaxID=2813578 RepID=A0ABX7NRR7_9BACT|nr:hypothetical protein [Pyxidicoccus parkwaysis]QSQ20197.1 hypothetical protein JY651_33700 [Pyxidicoccus parkwaysis]
MLSLFAAVLLAAAPSPASPRTSLLAPDSGRHLSARLLVAQAPTEGTPGVAPPSAPPSAPPLAPPVDADLDARIRKLTTEVNLLQSEIRSIDVNFPIGSLLLAYCGYVLTPMLLIGIPLIIFGLDQEDPDDETALLRWGTGLTAVGVVGVGLVIAGLVSGSNEANGNRLKREELVRERIRMEDELRDLKARRDARGSLQARRWQPRPTLPLVALRF